MTLSLRHARVGATLVSLILVAACSRVGIDGYPDVGSSQGADATLGDDAAVTPDTSIVDDSDSGGRPVEPQPADGGPNPGTDSGPIGIDTSIEEPDIVLPPTREICDDGADNDGDGLIDCQDTEDCDVCGDESCVDDVERLGNEGFFIDMILETFASCEGEGDSFEQCFVDVFSGISGSDIGCNSCLSRDAECVATRCGICLETRFDDRRCERCLDRSCDTSQDACF
jgi:hypothetical protein